MGKKSKDKTVKKEDKPKKEVAVKASATLQAARETKETHSSNTELFRYCTDQFNQPTRELDTVPINAGMLHKAWQSRPQRTCGGGRDWTDRKTTRQSLTHG